MNKINIYKIFMIIVFSIVLTFPTAALSKTDAATFNGAIEGALCAIQGEVCPSEDLGVHLITEVNFVLRAPDGKYYYLPNLNRSIKARYAGKSVRITGKAKGESIIADKLEVKEGGKYKLVWSRQKEKREIMNYFENITMG